MNINAMQKRLRDFAADRDWQPFHSPKNLAMALMVESAELLELFQWLTTEQSHTLTKVPEDREKVADEIADVLLYLLQIADATGIDIEDAVEKKLIKNVQKHPPKRVQEVQPGPKVHLLVDWENVQPDPDSLKQLLPDGTDVWLFHAPAQRMNAEAHKKAYGSNSVTLVERTGAGKNALDFQLSYYAGYLMARQPDARFVVVSNDKGYEPMLEHARRLDFLATRTEYRKPVRQLVQPAPQVVVTAQKVSAVKTKIKTKVVSTPLPGLEPTPARIAFRLQERLLRLNAEQRPKNWDELVSMAESVVTESIASKLDLARKACTVLQLHGTVMRDVDGGNFRYRNAADTVVNGPSATDSVAAVGVPAMPTPDSITATPSKPRKLVKPCEATPVQLGEKTDVDDSRKVGATKDALKASTKSAPQVSQIARKVEASLKKMSRNLPGQRDGLMKVISTHLSPSVSQVITPQKVCTVLQARQVVKISSQGAVLYFDAAKSVKPKRIGVQVQTQG